MAIIILSSSIIHIFVFKLENRERRISKVTLLYLGPHLLDPWLPLRVWKHAQRFLPPEWEPGASSLFLWGGWCDKHRYWGHYGLTATVPHVWEAYGGCHSCCSQIKNQLASQEAGPSSKAQVRQTLATILIKPPCQGLLFFLDLHIKVSRSWNKLYSSCLYSPTVTNYSNIVGLKEQGYGVMSRVEQMLCKLSLSLHNIVSETPRASLQVGQKNIDLGTESL